jgi:hypothetical protein
MHVDGDTLYWAQRSILFRASKDGSGEPIAFGWWATTNGGSRVLSDETYTYWHDGPNIVRKRKDSTKLSPLEPLFRYNIPWLHFDFQEDIEPIPLGIDSLSVAMIDKDDTHLYVAAPGCTPIWTIDLQTLDVQVMELTLPEHRTSSDLVVDETHIYCGDRLWLVRFEKDGANLELLHDEFTLLMDLAMGPDAVYALDRQVNTPPFLFALPKTGGMVTYGQSPTSGTANLFRFPLHLDVSRARLYWNVDTLVSLDLESSAFSVLSPTEHVEDFGDYAYAHAGDEHHFYWAGRLERGKQIGTIRVHKDRFEDAQGEAGL